MDLQSDLTGAVGDLIDYFRPTMRATTYRRVVPASYDVTAGAVTATTTDLPGLLVKYEAYTIEERLNLGIAPELQKALILDTDLGWMSPPTIGDILVEGDGTLITVVDIANDGINALWMLQVRRPH